MNPSPKEILENINQPADGSGGEVRSSVFASDPYVASSNGERRRAASGPPKTVEEILKSIQGYQVDECVSSKHPDVNQHSAIELPVSEPLNSNPHLAVDDPAEGTPINPQPNCPGNQPQPVPCSPSDRTCKVATGAATESEILREQWESQTHIPVIPKIPAIPKSDGRVAGQVVARPWQPPTAEATDLDDEPSPELNIREFSLDQESRTDDRPAPIRSAFEVDPDFYDFEIFDPTAEDVTSVNLGSRRLSNPNRAPYQCEPQLAGCGIATLDDPDGNLVDDCEKNLASPEIELIQAQNATAELLPTPETSPAQHESQPSNCILAAPDDLIQIDGKDGFGHIDLACFDLSQAVFQQNRIQITCEDGSSFTVEFCDVPYAIFAHGIEVELAGR